jgi:hypothetical protein
MCMQMNIRATRTGELYGYVFPGLGVCGGGDDGVEVTCVVVSCGGWLALVAADSYYSFICLVFSRARPTSSSLRFHLHGLIREVCLAMDQESFLLRFVAVEFQSMLGVRVLTLFTCIDFSFKQRRTTLAHMLRTAVVMQTATYIWMDH